MKRIISIAIVALALVATGCVNNPIDEPTPQTTKVKLWGGVRTSKATRGEEESVRVPSERSAAASNQGIRGPMYGGSLDIGIVRVSELEDADIFPDFRSLGDPVLASLGEVDSNDGTIRPIEFKSQAQFFPNSESRLRYAAWYPWSDSDLSTPNVADDGSTYSSDENATYITSEITGSKDVMYGNVIEGSYENGMPVMQFDHALCVFRFHVYTMVGYNEFGDEIAVTDWGTLRELTLENVPHTVRMSLPHLCKEVVDGKPVHNGENGNVFTLEYSDYAPLELHNTEGVPFDVPVVLPLGINNMEMVSEVITGPPANNVLRLDISTSTHPDPHKVAIARNFQPGHAYDIVLRFSDYGLINVDAVVGEWKLNDPIKEDVGFDMFYDLSTYGTSNCYTVRSANYAYCFNCDVKGNGKGEVVGMTAEDAKLDTRWVDVLWSDLPSDVDINGDGSPDELFKLRSNHPTENKVIFDLYGYGYDPATVTHINTLKDKRLPATGNVLIGGYDGDPAAGGKLIWTWHLWITHQPQEIGCGNGFVMLDRNIGAKTEVPTTGGIDDPAHGLLFQWGRPTPLRKEVTATTDLLTLEDMFPSNDSYNIMYGKGNGTDSWLTPSSKWFENHNNIWGDTGYDHEHPVKTLYDPCPPGYVVSNYAFWRDYELYEVAYESRGVRSNRQSNNVWLPVTTVYNSSAEVDTTYDGIITMRTSSIDRADGHPYNFFYTGSRTATRSSVGANCNYAIPVRCIKAAMAPAVIDLSESQTANCYVVTEPGYYKFKATVRGNGVVELWPFGNSTNKVMLEFGDGMTPTMNPDRVELLWWQGDFSEMRGVSDAEMISKLQCIEVQNDGQLKDGYVEFLVRERNFHPGNAGLAAYDAAGNILWTWHIWMPASQPENVRSGRRTVQDRNLGATQVPTINGNTISFANNEAIWSTYGFYYQWGRKDPIMMGPVGNKTNSDFNGGTITCAPYWTKAYGSDTWTKQTTIPRVSSQVRPSLVVRNPLAFIYTSSANGNAASMWYPSFSDLNTNNAMWGYAVMGTGIGEDFSKTFYDPCPPGYRTAFHTVWRDANGGGYGGDDSGTETYSWSTEDDFTSEGFVTIKTNFEQTFYPYAGRLTNTGRRENVGTEGYMTSGMPMGNYDTRTYRYGGNNKNSQQVTSEGRSYGRSVRCMKE